MALHCLAALARCTRVHPLPFSPSLPAVQVALISGKTMRGGPKTWVKAPWPYKQKPYKGLMSFFDVTRSRWDDNSKLVVVEGPPGAGKEAVARALAEEFEMQYMPAASGELAFVNEYGYDERELNDRLPFRTQFLEPKHFLANPHDERLGQMQLNWYEFKLSQYCDALAHLMNTGQGVVMNKCVLSDFVYMEAMCKAGCVSRGVRSVYREVAANVAPYLLRPHLVVYLDIPVTEVKKRVKARARPDEVDSPALSETFLTALESEYKTGWLKKIGEHSVVLMYDVATETIVEHMVDDIEKLDFDQYDFNTDMMEDWTRFSDDQWDGYRAMYTNRKQMVRNMMKVPRFDVPELMDEQENIKKFYDVYEEEGKGTKFRHGYNPEMGDSVLFKLADGTSYRDTTRY